MDQLEFHRASDRRCYDGACCSDLQMEIDSVRDAVEKIKGFIPNFSCTYYPNGGYYIGFDKYKILTKDCNSKQEALQIVWEMIQNGYRGAA